MNYKDLHLLMSLTLMIISNSYASAAYEIVDSYTRKFDLKELSLNQVNFLSENNSFTLSNKSFEQSVCFESIQKSIRLNCISQSGIRTKFIEQSKLCETSSSALKILAPKLDFIEQAYPSRNFINTNKIKLVYNSVIKSSLLYSFKQNNKLNALEFSIFNKFKFPILEQIGSNFNNYKIIT